MATTITNKKSKEHLPKTYNGMELIQLEPKMYFPDATGHVAIRTTIVMGRPWLDLITQLIHEGYVNKERSMEEFYSLGDFISAAVKEKLERVFMDTEALGVLYQKRLQKDHKPIHYHFKGINDGLWDKHKPGDREGLLYQVKEAD